MRERAISAPASSRTTISDSTERCFSSVGKLWPAPSAIAGRSGDVSTEELTRTLALPVYMDVFHLLAKIGVYLGLGAFVLSFLVSRLMKGIK
jgi:hypothetical protein